MANRRMFSLSVIDTDLFMEMPVTSRLLYYELGMRADDDGFVANWKKIMRATGLADDDMKVLIAKKFIIPFDSGVIVIRHWRMNNYLRNDRYTPTIYQEEKSKLVNNNDTYELETTENSTMLPSGIPTVYTGKDRIGKVSNSLYSFKEKIKEKKTELESQYQKDHIYVYLMNWIKQQNDFYELSENEQRKILSEA